MTGPTQPEDSYATSSCGNERIPLRALLNSAVKAFHSGIAHPPDSRSLAKVEEAAKGLHMPPLSALDRVTLARISAHRERALSLARSGDLEEAATAMKAARLLMSFAHCSPNAAAVAETSHYAAISYLSYRRGDYARARHEMVRALRATDRISRLTGDNPLLAARRVHLVHNIMRVNVAARLIADGLQLGFAILRYLTEGPAKWPSDYGPGSESMPHPLIALYHSNKIVETIAEAVEGSPDQERIIACHPEIKRLTNCPQPPSPRAWSWLSLKRCQIEGRTEEFVGNAASFLSKGPGTTPTLWYAVALDILVLYARHEPGHARKTTAAMVATMAASSAVPSFVRAKVGRAVSRHQLRE